MLFLVGCGSSATPFASTKMPPTLPGGGTSSFPTVPPLDAPGIATVTPDPINNPVVISEVMHAGSNLETIIIRNISGQVQDINGYSLLNPDTGESINIFNVKLAPGGTFNIYNGPSAKNETNGLAWQSIPVLNVAGASVYLLNHAGRLIGHYTYYP